MKSELTFAVFGASGRTGRALVEQALEAGHRVRAVVRRGSVFSQEHPRLTVHEGDVLSDSTIVVEAVTGADAVLSALGPHTARRPTNVCSQGTRNICEAMLGVRAERLVVVSALPICPESEKGVWDRLVVHPLLGQFLRGSFDDLRRMERYLAEARGIDRTIFRPPLLRNGPAIGARRTAVDERLPGARQIRRADLAAAMLESTFDRRLIHKTVNLAA